MNRWQWLATQARAKNRMDWIREQAYGRILDVGCNDGHIFNGTDRNVTGCDLDAWSPRYPGGFVQCDAQDLKPFKDKEFDCAVLGEILEHIEDPAKALGEAKRVARVIIFTVPYEHNWEPQNKPFMALQDKVRLDGVSAEELARRETTAKEGCRGTVDEVSHPHLWHQRYFDADSVMALLEGADLRYRMTMLSYEGWSFLVGVGW